jgi:hypothetical protein
MPVSAYTGVVGTEEEQSLEDFGFSRVRTDTRNAGFRIGLAAVLVVTFGLTEQGGVLAQMMGGGMGHGIHAHGAGRMGHDMATMPGLRGLDATPEESAELATMFGNFDRITREVTYLPDGIRTVTFSEDEDLMSVVVSHVVGMIDRVEEGRDPQVFIQSPTLDILFERRDTITTTIETTEKGIIVVQTSDDTEVVAALHTHAAEVSDMVDRGMEAVHEAMMQRAARP